MNMPDFSLSSDTTKKLCTTLQAQLVDLTNLALQAKQGHWNLVGPRFRAIHNHLDEIVDTLREHGDAVAERITTLGGAADGRVATLAKDTKLPEFPGGEVADQVVVGAISENLATFVRNARASLPELGELDPVSEDLVIGLVGAIEKHQWMLRSHLQSA